MQVLLLGSQNNKSNLIMEAKRNYFRNLTNTKEFIVEPVTRSKTLTDLIKAYHADGAVDEYINHALHVSHLAFYSNLCRHLHHDCTLDCATRDTLKEETRELHFPRAMRVFHEALSSLVV
jgi:hypothetical protein